MSSTLEVRVETALRNQYGQQHCKYCSLWKCRSGSTQYDVCKQTRVQQIGGNFKSLLL